MSKSVLVIDTPDSCETCPFFRNESNDVNCIAHIDSKSLIFPKGFRPNWCPLTPIKGIPYADRWFSSEYTLGYNACIYRITGGVIPIPM